MKHLILSISLLASAASLHATAVPQVPDTPLDTGVPALTTTHSLANTPPAQSPLVRAARATTRTKKKSAVITNDNLLKSGGHITTAKALRPLPNLTPAEMTPEQARAIEKKNRENREAKKAQAQQAKAAQKLQNDRNAAIYNGDDAEGMLDDPALVEGRMNPQQPKPDAPPPPQKPPVD